MNTQLTEHQTKPTGLSMQPQNMDQAMQLAHIVAHSALAPKAYAGKPEDALVAMMMGHEIGLNPMQSLQNIAVINGRPSVWGDAMLALVQNHPAFGGIKEDFDDATMTATCTVWRKGGERHTVYFSQQDAQTAGLWGKSGPWQQHPKRMLKLRARGFALRDQFADALLGLISAEEARDLDTADSAPIEHRPAKKQAVTPPTTYYTDEEFHAKLPGWEAAIKSGRFSQVNDLINLVESKGKKFTDEQKMQLAELEPINAEYTEEVA